jgi:hypothetical protein
MFLKKEKRKINLPLKSIRIGTIIFIKLGEKGNVDYREDCQCLLRTIQGRKKNSFIDM